MTQEENWDELLRPILEIAARDGSFGYNFDILCAHLNLSKFESLDKDEQEKLRSHSIAAVDFLKRIGAIEHEPIPVLASGARRRPIRKYVLTDPGQALLDFAPENFSAEHLGRICGLIPLDDDFEVYIAKALTGRNRNARLKISVKLLDPNSQFFCKAASNLLIAMEYIPPSSQNALELISDGDSIDGEISMDPLGVQRLYIRARRFSSSVGLPELREMVGAMGETSQKGLLITPSKVTPEAIGYANSLNGKLILVDHERLLNLLEEYSIGLRPLTIHKTIVFDESFLS